MSGLLVPMIVKTIPNEDKNSKLMKSMISMATIGFGEIVGGPFIGQIIDRYGNRLASFLTILILIFELIIT